MLPEEGLGFGALTLIAPRIRSEIEGTARRRA